MGRYLGSSHERKWSGVSVLLWHIGQEGVWCLLIWFRRWWIGNHSWINLTVNVCCQKGKRLSARPWQSQSMDSHMAVVQENFVQRYLHISKELYSWRIVWRSLLVRGTPRWRMSTREKRRVWVVGRSRWLIDLSTSVARRSQWQLSCSCQVSWCSCFLESWWPFTCWNKKLLELYSLFMIPTISKQRSASQAVPMDE